MRQPLSCSATFCLRQCDENEYLTPGMIVYNSRYLSLGSRLRTSWIYTALATSFRCGM